MTVLIGYDLNRPGQDYSDLSAKIKSFGAWWHCLDSTWIVKTELAPVQVRDALLPLLDANDEVFVVDITGQAAAWVGFKDNCQTWLKDNL